MTQKKKYSLMTKVAFLLLIIILPFNIIGILVSIMSYQNSLSRMEDMLSYTVNSNANLLEVEMSNSHTLLYELTYTNINLRNMCTTDSELTYLINRQELNNYFKDITRVSNVADTFFIYVIETDDYIPLSGYDAFNAGTKPFFSYIENYEPAHSSWFLSKDNTALIRILYDSEYHIYYGAAIDLSSFIDQLDVSEDFHLNYTFDTEPITSTGSNACWNYKISNEVYFNASIDKYELTHNIDLVQYAVLSFFVIYLALIPVLIYLMKRYVDRPLAKLNHAHRQLQAGNECYRIEASSNSAEFEEAYHSFNSMAISLQQLHNEIIQKEVANKQLQIDFLQLQIRPHFLLNAFNVLYTLIQRGQRDSSQEMILFLSDYFRYLFRSGRALQLFSKERTLIEDYLKISRIYYPDSFEVSYQIDPILNMMRVPPLLFHSFIENIIAHAILPHRLVHIVFSGEYDEGIATFYISDDGKGMDADAVDAINHMGTRPIDDGKNIGIKNSIQRLIYYYGENAYVECDSEPDVGTTFTIVIPYNLEET